MAQTGLGGTAMRPFMRNLCRSLLPALVLAAADSRAGATIDLLFVGGNGIPIAPTRQVTATLGDQVTMALIMRNDEPLTAAVFSLAYDLSNDTLDVVSAFQWHGLAINKQASDFFAPIAGLNPISSTFVGAFQGATTNLSLPRTLPPAGGAFAGGYQMGTVVWRVVSPGFAFITGGIIHPALDVLGDSEFNRISNLLQAGTATLIVGDEPIPEPGTAALLGLGLVGLALVHRRCAGGGGYQPSRRPPSNQSQSR